MSARRKPQVGDIASSKYGLDPREVARVSDDGKLIWLYFLTPDVEYGPFRASNYTFKPVPR